MKSERVRAWGEVPVPSCFVFALFVAFRSAVLPLRYPARPHFQLSVTTPAVRFFYFFFLFLQHKFSRDFVVLAIEPHIYHVKVFFSFFSKLPAEM